MKHTVTLFFLFACLLSIAQPEENPSGSRSFEANWESIGPGQVGGRTYALLFDNRDASGKTIYAGSNGGGLWKSYDGANTWQQIGGAYNRTIACIAQADDGRIYFGTGASDRILSSRIATGNGIYHLDEHDHVIHLPSTESNLFTASPNNTWSSVYSIAISPTNRDTMLAGTENGLWITDNRGASWSKASPSGANANSDFRVVKFNSDATIGYASSGVFSSNFFVRSTNGGKTWQKIDSSSAPGFPARYGRIIIATSPTHPNYVYISVASNSGAFEGVYKSTDGGGTWTKILSRTATINPFTSSNVGWYANAITVSSTDPEKVFLGCNGLFVYSPSVGWIISNQATDNVLSAAPEFVGKYVHTIVESKTVPEDILLGTDRGIYKSENAIRGFPTLSFRPKNREYISMLAYDACATQQGDVLCSFQDGGQMRLQCETGSTPWLVSTNDYGYVAASSLSPNFLFVGGDFGKLRRSRNAGQSFSCVYTSAISGTSGCKTSCAANFVSPYQLIETNRAIANPDSAIYVAAYPHFVNDTIVAKSNIGNQTIVHTLTSALNTGEAIRLHDPYQSRLFVADNCGISFSPDAVKDNNNPRWYRMALGPYGSAKIVGTSDGNTIYMASFRQIVKVSGINTISNYPNRPVGDSLVVNRNIVRQLGTNESVISICINPKNDNHVMYSAKPRNTQDSLLLFETHDGGVTWQNLRVGFKGLPIYDCLIDASDTNRYFLGTERGILVSENRGNTWQQANGNIGQTPVFKLRQTAVGCPDCYVLIASAFGSGVWQLESPYNSSCTTYNEVEHLAQGESTLQLKVFPNPANQSFSVAVPDGWSNAEVTLYGLNGQAILNKTITTSESAIELKSIERGLYFVVAVSQTKQRAVAKLVVSD